MGRLYWIGLALVFCGVAVQAAPVRDWRFVLYSVGVLVQVAGVVCIFAEVVRRTRSRQGLDGKARLLIGLGLGVFVLGVVLGFAFTR